MSISNPKSVQAWQQYLSSIYGNTNERKSWDSISTYLFMYNGFLFKNIARSGSSFENIHYIRVISWLIALANKFQIDLGDAFLRKYPEVCPYCYSAPCNCFVEKKFMRSTQNRAALMGTEEQGSRDIEVHYKSVSARHEPIGFANAMKIHSKIYPSNEIIWHFSGNNYHFLRTYEELSELQATLSKYEKKDLGLNALRNSFADYFSWLISLWFILRQDEDLNHVLMEYYRHGCTVCESIPCICKDRSERATEIVNIKALEEAENSLKELKDALTVQDQRIDEALDLMRAAIDLQDEAKALRAARLIAPEVDAVQKKSSKWLTVDNAGKVAEIINKLSKSIPYFSGLL